MSNYIAILGTDTDVGKTTVTAGLAKAIHSLGAKVSVIKPVQTGCALQSDGSLVAPDIEVVCDACSDINGYFFSLLKEPCSPHLAASIENKNIYIDDIITSFGEWEKKNAFDITLVEFAGGLMVPFNSKETQEDLLKAFPMPVLLVVPNRLGAVNHALLTLKALKEIDIDVLGVIFSSPQESIASHLEKSIQKDNRKIITSMGCTDFKGEIPFLETLSSKNREERSSAWNTVAELLLPLAKTLINTIDI